MTKKIASLIYGAGAYLLFLGVFLYLIAFATNIAPHSISGAPSLPPLLATLVDIALITLFGLQHGIMARPGFKLWWTRFVPPHLERSTFVWFADAMVLIIVWFWQPIAGDLWDNGRGHDRAVCGLPAWMADDTGHQLPHGSL